MTAHTPNQRLYFDNAATSFPKPPQVLDAITHYHNNLGASPGRGAYAESRDAAAILDQCRTRLATLLSAESPDTISFAHNTTDALNTAIKGLLLPKLAAQTPVHVVMSAMEHNSILRPINALKALFPTTLTSTIVQADPATGRIDPAVVRAAITPHTKLVAVNHASNVTGTLQPIDRIAAACRQLAVPLLVDAAQTVGHIPINVQALGIDLLAAPGHKGLLGPLGTGFLYIRNGLERHIHTSREGGTGSVSEHDTHPTTRPDKYEPGSHNTLGIAGLNAALGYILHRTVEEIHQHHNALTAQFINGLHQYTGGPLLKGLTLLGPQGVNHRIGVFSITVDNTTPNQLADQLETDFGILTRPGLHCAPHAHATFNTHPAATNHPGATRFSVGPFLSTQDVKFATDALAELCEHHASRAAPHAHA